MSQEFVYSVINRPPLGAENLVFRRRVSKTTKSESSKKSGSKEEKFLGSDTTEETFDSYLNRERHSKGRHIDDEA